MDEKFTPAFIAEQRKLANEATSITICTIDKYQHGGGRVFVDGRSGERELVADFYEQNNRDYWISAASNYPSALENIAWLLFKNSEMRLAILDLLATMEHFGGYAKCALEHNTPEYMKEYWERFNQFETIFDEMAEKWRPKGEP